MVKMQEKHSPSVFLCLVVAGDRAGHFAYLPAAKRTRRTFIKSNFLTPIIVGKLIKTGLRKHEFLDLGYLDIMIFRISGCFFVDLRDDVFSVQQPVYRIPRNPDVQADARATCGQYWTFKRKFRAIP